MTKLTYIGVLEEVDNDGTHWSVTIGSPNPREEKNWIDCETKEQAFKIQSFLTSELQGLGERIIEEMENTDHKDCGNCLLYEEIESLIRSLTSPDLSDKQNKE